MGNMQAAAVQPGLYRLLTTLLDEKTAPALELASLYHQRWEVEAVFDELKTHLLQKRRVLRSKTADLVRQEFYGWVLAHYAVRWLMHQAASEHRLSDRQSILYRERATAALRTAPIRGLSPQRGLDRANGGLMPCLPPPQIQGASRAEGCTIRG